MIDEKKLIAHLERERNYWLRSTAPYSLELVCAYSDILDFVNEQPKVGEWIPCSERLPEEKESVLVQWEKYDRYLNVTAIYLDAMWLDDAEEKVFETINGVPNGKVIAWQPLPEPWKGE